MRRGRFNAGVFVDCEMDSSCVGRVERGAQGCTCGLFTFMEIDRGVRLEMTAANNAEYSAAFRAAVRAKHPAVHQLKKKRAVGEHGAMGSTQAKAASARAMRMQSRGVIR